MNKQVREEFEKAYPMPFACGWNSMTNEYQCIWEEHAGETEVEFAIVQHNDRLAAWVASRASLVITLPEPQQKPSPGAGQYREGRSDGIEAGIIQCIKAIERQGFKVEA